MREVRQQICATHEFQTATFRFLLNLYIGGGHLGGLGFIFILCGFFVAFNFSSKAEVFPCPHFRINAKTIHTPVRGRLFIDRKLCQNVQSLPVAS